MKTTKYLWENEHLSNLLGLVQKLVFVIGIPFSVYQYYVSNHKERDDRQYFIYDNMDKKYWEYEMLAAKYPLLGVSDAVIGDSLLIRHLKPDSLYSDEENIIKKQMMLLLISMHERAFIMYSNSENEFRKRQWDGWSSDLKQWLKVKSFVETWKRVGSDFDHKFQEYVNQRIKVDGI